MDGNVSDEETCVPNYGFKIKLNHVYPEKWKQGVVPTFRQLWQILPLIFRYTWYYIKLLWHGRVPIMDYFKFQQAKQIYGVPIGGIGSGSIGRGFRGEFCRFQLKPGIYEYNTVDANQFIATIKDASGKTLFQSVLSTYKKQSRSLSSWKWLLDGSKCYYTGLYPRAWTEYDLSKYGVKLICRQISPVIPHNYVDSCLPCAVFVWTIENVSEEERKVTIAFSFKNGTGNKKSDKAATCSSKTFSYLESEGVVLHNTIDKMSCTYGLSARAREDISISKFLQFDPNSDGSKLWNELYENGKFDKVLSQSSEQVFGEMACAIAAQVRVQPGKLKSLEMCLAWDMPVVNFLGSSRKHKKYYTNFYGSENATLKIVDRAFNNYRKWENAIHTAQKTVLDDSKLPDWYKGALFNETYFVSDGGTVWLKLSEEESNNLPDTDPRLKYGRFAYLEGHEYRMYNTYDVHFYASFALSMNWPQLQNLIQYDMKDAIHTEIKKKMTMLYDGVVAERKVKNTVPHDLGDPGEDPFTIPNAYCIHDVSEWRDLNVKFVLQVFRDYQATKDKQYLQDMYEACQLVMAKSEKFDADGDGLIENSGSPDQTYDTWVMTGSSAYCGGLWIGALHSMIEISKTLGKLEEQKRYSEILERGLKSYDKKLWNGSYYKFDEANYDGTIMSDQLCGHWYLRCSGVDQEVFPQNKVNSALKMIYNNNVLRYYNGTLGAVNGYVPGRGVDRTTLQSEEMWIGITYALASSMIQEGMISEAWNTAGGMYNSLTQRLGLAYESPEALLAPKGYRSIGYMRPLSIWSIQLAWEQYKQQDIH